MVFEGNKCFAFFSFVQSDRQFLNCSKYVLVRRRFAKWCPSDPCLHVFVTLSCIVVLYVIDKHFPPNHKLHKIFNRNTVKISYSCMNNVKSIISTHMFSLKTIKKINLLILNIKYCLYFVFKNSRGIHAIQAKIPVFLSCLSINLLVVYYKSGVLIV